MDFVGFLNFVVKCFDVVAWPLFALGYPLCASIWAIESNSNLDAQKLVTYWVLFSLILLFEHAFVKLLAWLPFWPYIKLMTICWLMIPHFDGAFYVYKHVVRPCFSINQQVIINWFNKRKERYMLKKFEDFQIAVDRYVKENGSEEALKKLLSGKVKSTNANFAQTENQAVTAADIKEEVDVVAEAKRHRAISEELKAKCPATKYEDSPTSTSEKSDQPKEEPKKYAASSEWNQENTKKQGGKVPVIKTNEKHGRKRSRKTKVKSTEANFAQTENHAVTAADIKEEVEVVAGAKRHEAISEELKEKSPATKYEGSPLSTSKKSDQPKKYAASSEWNLENTKNQGEKVHVIKTNEKRRWRRSRKSKVESGEFDYIV